MEEQPEYKQPAIKNLYQRISAVMQDVEYLKKDDSVGSGNYAYKAISEEKVTETVRQSLIKNGLVILPVEQIHKLTDHQRPDRNGVASIVPISTVDTKYKIINIDNPQEFEILCSSGTGVDPQDKGVGKAMTYSYKYMLLRTFAIPTGEDPDKVHNAELEKQQKQNKPAQGTQAPQQGNDKPKQESAPPVAPATAETPNVRYASAKQKEEIIRLLNNPVIQREEKTKMLLNIKRFDEERAAAAIEKLKKVIKDREDGHSSAA